MRVVVNGLVLGGVVYEGWAEDGRVKFEQCLPEAIISGWAVKKNVSIGSYEDHGWKG